MLFPAYPFTGELILTQGRFASVIRLRYTLIHRGRKYGNSGRCEQAGVAHIHGVSYGIDCKSMRTKVRAYAVYDFVLVSVKSD